MPIDAKQELQAFTQAMERIRDSDERIKFVDESFETIAHAQRVVIRDLSRSLADCQRTRDAAQAEASRLTLEVRALREAASLRELRQQPADPVRVTSLGLTFEDTGERRYPKQGEFYRWEPNFVAEQLSGVYISEVPSENAQFGFYGEPQKFHIYRRVEP